ncbi:MAG: glycogen synthase [Solirubrobacteraceae bacterium]|nr:glycogen synthase [Solirubrobacteraceae bacterium]
MRRFALPLPRMAATDLVRFPVRAPAALSRLGRAAKQVRPDVIHVQCFSSNGVYAAALCAITGIPCIVTLQGETFMDDNDIYEHSRVLPTALRVGLRRAKAVTGCSRCVLNDAERRFGLGPGIGQVIPNGVDVASSESQLGLDLPFARFVLSIGRVVEKKGFDLLLHAFERVAANDREVGLVIGGDGAEREALAQRTEALGLGSRVVFPGTLSRLQVAWAMAHASVFVLPSRIEPFGIVVLEALRAGRPVVVSSRGGAPEIVRDQQDGLVVDPFDTRAMATAIARLLDDDGLRRRLSAAAVLRARDFSWDVIAERYRRIYGDVLGESGMSVGGATASGEQAE